jgi:hypothetical protein
LINPTTLAAASNFKQFYYLSRLPSVLSRPPASSPIRLTILTSSSEE